MFSSNLFQPKSYINFFIPPYKTILEILYSPPEQKVDSRYDCIKQLRYGFTTLPSSLYLLLLLFKQVDLKTERIALGNNYGRQSLPLTSYRRKEKVT